MSIDKSLDGVTLVGNGKVALHQLHVDERWKWQEFHCHGLFGLVQSLDSFSKCSCADAPFCYVAWWHRRVVREVESVMMEALRNVIESPMPEREADSFSFSGSISEDEDSSHSTYSQSESPPAENVV